MNDDVRIRVLFMSMGNMCLYEPTWPTAVLQELREQVVSLRVTLSYFIESIEGRPIEAVIEI